MKDRLNSFLGSDRRKGEVGNTGGHFNKSSHLWRRCWFGDYRKRTGRLFNALTQRCCKVNCSVNPATQRIFGSLFTLVFLPLRDDYICSEESEECTKPPHGLIHVYICIYLYICIYISIHIYHYNKKNFTNSPNVKLNMALQEKWVEVIKVCNTRPLNCLLNSAQIPPVRVQTSQPGPNL